MKKLVKKGFQLDNVISYGNMFLIGNGHLGYRGTLEEFSRNEMVGLNVVGVYDQYKDKWKESLNMPNPFFALLKSEDNEFSVLKNIHLDHQVTLDLSKAMFKRKTTYNEVEIKSERFVSHYHDNLLAMKYEVKVLKDIKLNLTIGMDENIYEINGPHFPLKEITLNNNVVCFKGKTNSNKKIYEQVNYHFPSSCIVNSFNNGLFDVTINGKENKTYTFIVIAKIFEKKPKILINYKKKDYEMLKRKHIEVLENKWKISDVKIKGNKEADFALRYSIYHLLILGNEKHITSIPARGVSGQTYKGAIFWDTEIFMLPFFTLTNPKVAKNLLLYRINTLSGALRKAKKYGYDGAFYAWESVDKGKEACSIYNVTDPITNKKIRTYFKDKQIHISADVAYGIIQYCRVSNDDSLIIEGGLKVMCEVIKFYLSYAKFINNKYHLYDVLGPDEYHERVNDNAFTNYLVYFVTQETIKYLYKYESNSNLIDTFVDFKEKLYLPSVNNDNLIEQFDGYFAKEDVSIEVLKTRLKHPKEYWGGKNGVASNTKVIKQADVVTLLVLLSNDFDNEVKMANFDYYIKYTEHGSSLSSSMYSILASNINKTDIAYDMFIKSASIDLGTNQKMFAGGIYIGGTHPASNGGAYLSVVFGMLGLQFIDNKIVLNPHLPKKIKGINFNILYQNKKYNINVFNDNTYKVEVVYD